MNWRSIFAISLKWIDKIGDWADGVSKEVKRRKTLNDINKIGNAIDGSDDQFIIDELHKLVQKVEDRKKSS